MFENLLNVFGKSKQKSNGGRAPNDLNSTLPNQPGTSQMTGPFSSSTPQMPQPPNLPYPPAPYPPNHSSSQMYPPLPFSQPSMPSSSSAQPDSWQQSSYSTIAHNNHYSPLDSVPFEAALPKGTTTNLVSLDKLFKDSRQAIDKVNRTESYLRSKESDYDFKVEQGLIYQ